MTNKSLRHDLGAGWWLKRKLGTRHHGVHLKSQHLEAEAEGWPVWVTERLSKQNKTTTTKTLVSRKSVVNEMSLAVVRRWLQQEDCEFKACLDNLMKSCLKKERKKGRKEGSKEKKKKKKEK